MAVGMTNNLPPKTTRVTVIAANTIQIGELVYTISGDALTAPYGPISLNERVYTAAFSPNGKQLVLGGTFTGGAKIYAVYDDQIVFVTDIYMDNDGTAITGYVYGAAFSSDGGTLVLCGTTSIGVARVYSVVGTTVTYVSTLYHDNGTTPIPSMAYDVLFLGGGILALCGQFGINIYNITGTTVTYASKLYMDGATTPFNGTVTCLAFAPYYGTGINSLLFAGGWFTGYAKLYTVSDTNVITFLTNVYADTGTTALSGAVVCAAVITTEIYRYLAIGGDFTGRANLYIINPFGCYYQGAFPTIPLNLQVDGLTTTPYGTVILTNRDSVLSFYIDENHKAKLDNSLQTGTSNKYAVLIRRPVKITDYSSHKWLLLGTQAYSTSETSGKVYAYESTIEESFRLNIIPGSVFAFPSTDTVMGAVLAPVGNYPYYLVYGNMGLHGGIVYTAQLPWTAAPGNAALDLPDTTSLVRVAAFSAITNRVVLVGSYPGNAKLYGMAPGHLVYTTDLYRDSLNNPIEGTFNGAAFSPDGSLLVIVGAEMFSLPYAGVAYVYTKNESNNDYTFSSQLLYMAGTHPILSASFSPDGSLLVITTQYDGVKLYTVDGTTITYASNIYMDNNSTAFNGSCIFCTFSSAGTALVIGGNFTGKAKIYAVSGATVTFVSNIFADKNTTALDSAANTGRFSSAGSMFILGGQFTGRAKMYSVNGTALTFYADMLLNGAAITTPYIVRDVVIHDYTVILSFVGTNAATLAFYYVQPYTRQVERIGVCSEAFPLLASAEQHTYIDSTCTAICCVPTKPLVVVGGYFTGKAKLYSILEDQLTFISDVYADAGVMPIPGGVSAIAASPNGEYVIICSGATTASKVTLYSVSNDAVTFLSEIYMDNSGTPFNGQPHEVAFSPLGGLFIVSGIFTGYAKVYTISNGIVTFISNIAADAVGAALTSYAYSVAFSPAGTTVVLSGYFAAKAAIYSVSGSTVTFVSNIYADNAGTPLSSSADLATFSPSGTCLIIGGQFTGRAKVYSVSGSTVTFVSNIYADNAGTPLSSGTMRRAAFTPDGNYFIFFCGGYRYYSVAGTALTYISNIYMDNNAAPYDNTVMCTTFYNPTHFAVGGTFTGKIKMYSIYDGVVKYMERAELASSFTISGPAYQYTPGFAEKNASANTLIDIALLKGGN